MPKVKGREGSARQTLVVGLTGGIATGKTTVARLWQERGAVLIDADAVARDVVEPGQPVLEDIARRFGPGVLTEDGRLDRKALGAVVFRDEGARKDLEALLHPRIMDEMHRRLRAVPEGAIAVLDIPLLFETGRWLDKVDVVVTVYADRAVQRRRLATRDGLSPEEVERRLRAQWSTARKLSRADYVIYNQGDRDALRRQADDVWRALEGLRAEVGA